MNKLFYGDNLDVMRKFIRDETVDLCYIDPPFNSKRNYNQIYNNIGTEDRAQAQAFTDTWTWDDHAPKEKEESKMKRENEFLAEDGQRWRRRLSRLIWAGVALLALSFSAMIANGQKPEKAPKGFEIEYNRFNDDTRVDFVFDSLQPSKGGRLDLFLSFSHAGKTLAKDIEEFSFYFSGKCSSYFCFDDYDTLVFLVNDERMESNAKPTITYKSDSIGFNLRRSEVTRIAMAKTLEFQVGIFQVALKPKDIANIKTLLDLGTVKK